MFIKLDQMETEEFRKRGREVVDYIADYRTHIRSRRVIPEVEPGYIRKLLPDTAPKRGEEWDRIMEDIETAVMPGITHWQHPNFHAYFPAGNSYPSILGDMLSDALGCIGFSWAASPACTELETLVLDWVGKMIGLPNQFLHTSGIGGGVIQGSASESVLVALLSARHHTIKLLKQAQPYIEDCQILSKLVGYCSKLSHSCVEKAGMIGFVKMRHLDVDGHFALRGHVLEDAIEEDKKLGLIPFFVCATLGTTACCSFDNLGELGEVAKRQGVYLHVDAAYAGNALICPEFHYLKEGIENVDSFSFNTNKWLQVNFDCTLMWVKNVDMLTTALTVDPLYLQHKHGDKAIDLRHWGIPLSRRFRALKLWLVIRIYGVEGLQKRIRDHCRLAKLFASRVVSDEKFEILGDVAMGLVCFRLIGPNSLTQRLLKMINDSGKLHMVPAMLNEHYIIRFALCTEYANEEDIKFAWDVISLMAEQLLQSRHQCSVNKENGSRCAYDFEEDTFAAFEEEIIFDNQREHLQKAQVMRNLFFKMVSDPKCYNPRVLRSLGRQVSSERDNPAAVHISSFGDGNKIHQQRNRVHGYDKGSYLDKNKHWNEEENQDIVDKMSELDIVSSNEAKTDETMESRTSSFDRYYEGDEKNEGDIVHPCEIQIKLMKAKTKTAKKITTRAACVKNYRKRMNSEEIDDEKDVMEDEAKVYVDVK